MLVFATALIALVLVLSWPVGLVIDRSRWPAVYPGTAIVCWVGVLLGALASITALAVVLLLSPPAPAHGLLDWLDNCLPHHSRAGVISASVVSIAIVAFGSAGLTRGLPRLWRSVCQRRRHHEMLSMVAFEHEHHPDVLVVDHPLPVAYCVPARRRPIVVSTGAQERLEDTELAAILTHERTHLRQRHHLLLLLLDLTCTLLPWLPAVRRAKVSLPALLEMAADDAAARRYGGHVLTAALGRVGLVPGPAGALAAGGPGTALAHRLARLESAGSDVRPGTRALALITGFSMMAAPLATGALALAAIPLPC